MCSLSCVQLSVTPWTIPRQVLLSKKFFRLEYWSGFPCPPPGDLPNPGTEPTSPMSPALAGSFFITAREGQGIDGKSLYHLLRFAVNPKSPIKNSFIKK